MDGLVRASNLDPGEIPRWFDWARDHVRLPYQGTGTLEERARAALDAYAELYPAFQEIEKRIGDIRDFADSLREGLRALDHARETGEKGPRTLRGRGCIVIKLVPCGKNCHGCPHGPYAYEVHKVGGVQHWRYLGRA